MDNLKRLLGNKTSNELKRILEEEKLLLEELKEQSKKSKKAKDIEEYYYIQDEKMVYCELLIEEIENYFNKKEGQ